MELSLSLLLLIGTGCADEASGDAGDNSGDETTGDGDEGTTGDGDGNTTGDGDGDTEPLMIFGTVYELTASGIVPMPNPPVADAEVCFVSEGVELCTMTDADGDYEIPDVPAKTVGAIRFRAESLATFYHFVTTATEDIDDTISIDTPEIIADYYAQTGATPSEDGVVVLAEIFPDAKAEYAASLIPASGEGPFYYSAPDGSLDTMATTTKANLALAVFLDVDPTGGPYRAEFSKGGSVCTTPSFGDPIPDWTIPSDADVVYVQFACP